jgi:MFS family permease
VGLAYVGFAAAPSLAPACAAALVGGVGNGMQWAPLVSFVQRLTPQPLQGRVMGALESIGALFPAFGLLLGGALVALSTPRAAFLVVGAGAAFTTVAFALVTLSDEAERVPGSGGDGLRPDGTTGDDGHTAVRGIFAEEMSGGPTINELRTGAREEDAQLEQRRARRR